MLRVADNRFIVVRIVHTPLSPVRIDAGRAGASGAVCESVTFGSDGLTPAGEGTYLLPGTQCPESVATALDAATG